MNTQEADNNYSLAWRKVHSEDELQEGMVIYLAGSYCEIVCIINDFGDDYDLMVTPITLH